MFITPAWINKITIVWNILSHNTSLSLKRKFHSRFTSQTDVLPEETICIFLHLWISQVTPTTSTERMLSQLTNFMKIWGQKEQTCMLLTCPIIKKRQEHRTFFATEQKCLFRTRKKRRKKRTRKTLAKT